MLQVSKSFLGTGWKFPPSFDKAQQTIAMVSEDQDIRESLFILLSTRPGERVMRPEYGCDLQAFVFENMNATNLNFLKKIISRSVRYFEPRIDLDDITLNLDKLEEGQLLISLHYRVRTTNARSNIVFPFYLHEGTEVRLYQAG
ncbi:MAG: GPW/gp25 family protein [Microscillaceae bacterium]